MPLVRELGFNWRQHIPEDAEWPEAEAFFNDLFSGHLLSPHLTQANSIADLRTADRLVVKIGRGSLLLPWLIKRFQLPKPVWLIRHPCAVVGSQLLKGAWDHLPVMIDLPDHRHDQYLKQFKPLLIGIQTMEERQAALWCMEHKYLLEHPLNNEAWTTITYEELITRPEATITRIFNTWGMQVPEHAMDMVRIASPTTANGSPVHDPHTQLTQWTRNLRPEQVERILAVVAQFGITLYDRDPMPHRSFTS